MKKAVILVSGHQYLVSEGDIIEVNLLTSSVIGAPEVSDATVKTEVMKADIKDDKVTVIRFKPKKRVKKIRGHRQRLTVLKVTKITSK
jgi:large subunit ribosomal protein L21